MHEAIKYSMQLLLLLHLAASVRMQTINHRLEQEEGTLPAGIGVSAKMLTLYG
jgi:hypothetical protein